MTDHTRLAFSALYIYMSLAMVDGFVSDEELQTMITKLNLHDRYAGVDIPQVVHAVRQQLNQTPADRQLKELEHHLGEICHNEGERQQLLTDLEDIMEADGLVKSGEIDFFRHIRLLLM